MTQEALLRKRKRDDEKQRQRLDISAKNKAQKGRLRKDAEKIKTGKNVLMPEVFTSNYMKQ